MKRLISILLVFSLMLSMAPTVFAQENSTIPNMIDSTTAWSYLDDNSDPAVNIPAECDGHTETGSVQPIIEPVYGGGGKGDTPIANSFIELYNLADTDTDLSGYTLSDGTKNLQLNGTIPVNGYFLIVGAAEATTDEFLTCDLPQADLTCDWTISNKSYTISLLKDGEEVDFVTVGSSSETKISKQNSLKRTNHKDFGLVVWEKFL